MGLSNLSQQKRLAASVAGVGKRKSRYRVRNGVDGTRDSGGAAT